MISKVEPRHLGKPAYIYVHLRTSLGGAFAIARDWTDQTDPPPPTVPTILDGKCLLGLTTLLESVDQGVEKDLDK